MSVELNQDSVEFSNVTVVRDAEGQLTVYVGSEKMLGCMSVQIGGGACGFAIPMSRVRLAEKTPATPVVDNSNIIEFKNFKAAQLAVDNDAPTTDGDAQ